MSAANQRVVSVDKSECARGAVPTASTLDCPWVVQKMSILEMDDKNRDEQWCVVRSLSVADVCCDKE